ncbi:hypothetical protein Tco_0262352, partial [Tanacetum coccineum]
EPDIVADEYVLHKIVNVVDESRTVKQWVTYVVDSEKDCTELDEYCDMKVCHKLALLGLKTVQKLSIHLNLLHYHSNYVNIIDELRKP